MKKNFNLVLLFFISFSVNAQWVTIPDPAFATYLSQNFPQCMNGNQIDTTCVNVIDTTNMSLPPYNISDLTGIEYFDNLQFLYCGSNPIINLSDLPSTLLSLDVSSGGQLTQLPVLPTSLETLICNGNSLNSLPTLPSTLVTLECADNQLSVLPQLPPGLLMMKCSNNLFLQLPVLPNSLQTLIASDNLLTSLPSIPSTLENLNIFQNNVGSLPSLPNNLKYLTVSNNPLYTLPSILPDSLRYLLCASDSLSILPQFPSNLETLDCSYNQLNSLPNFPSTLRTLTCPGNMISSLPQLPYGLETMDISYNPILAIPNFPETISWSINCNGTLISELPALPVDFQVLSINDCINLTCLPELTEIGTINFSGTPIQCKPNYGTITASSPDITQLPICGIFNPNGCPVYGSITGTVFSDINNNCVMDVGENGLHNIKVELYENGLLEQQVFTDVLGNYMFITDTGTYTYTIDTLSFSISVSCPASGFHNSVLTIADSIDLNMDFGIKCPDTGFDIGIYNITTIGAFNPNTNATISVIAGDIATQTGVNCSPQIAGTVTIVLHGPVTFLSPGPLSLIPIVSGDTLIYTISDFSTVNPNSDFNFIVITDTTAVLGDSICIDVTVLPIAGDLNPANNTISQCFGVLVSFDPNDKSVSPIGNVHPDNDWLYYTIRFQNTGNAPAQHVYIMDTLDNDLKLETFQMTSHSHPVLTQVIGDVVFFNFPNINLPDSVSNEAGSHGYVQYKIQQQPSLINGTAIQNTAAIYFDFNAPVITNTVTTIIDNTVSVSELYNVADVSVYPNPAQSVISVAINSPGNTEAQMVLINIHNHVIEKINTTVYNGKNVFEISIEKFGSGVYFLHYISGKNIKTMKIVKL